MNKEEIKQEPNDGLIARILGGTPTILQKVFFILMAFLCAIQQYNHCRIVITRESKGKYY